MINDYRPAAHPLCCLRDTVRAQRRSNAVRAWYIANAARVASEDARGRLGCISSALLSNWGAGVGPSLVEQRKLAAACAPQ